MDVSSFTPPVFDVDLTPDLASLLLSYKFIIKLFILENDRKHEKKNAIKMSFNDLPKSIILIRTFILVPFDPFFS